MKKFIIAFSVILIFQGLMFGQDTTSTVFAPLGATWHYSEYVLVGPAVGYFKFEVTKDTFLLGYPAR